MRITPPIGRGAIVQQDPIITITARMVAHRIDIATAPRLTRHSHLYDNRMSEVVAGHYYNIHVACSMLRDESYKLM